MVKYLSQWYQRKFSDPHAVTLVIILSCLILFVYLFSDLLMPVFVALAIAFLLELPVNRLMHLGLSRLAAVIIVVTGFVGLSLIATLGLLPTIWRQSSNLLQEVPNMITQWQSYLLTLPEQYPELIKADQVETFISLVNEKILEWGQVVIQASLNSIAIQT